MDEPWIFRASRMWLTIVVGVTMAVTNPSEEKHRHTIYNHMVSKAPKEGWWLKYGVTDKRDFDAIPMEYHNHFYLFSTVTCGEDRLTIGIFGNVVRSTT